MAGKKGFITVALGCYFIFLLYLLRTKEIKLFINPRLSFLTVITVIFLGLMLLRNVLELAGGRKERPELHENCGEDHEGHLKKFAPDKSNYLIFLPIVLSMIVAPRALSYQMNGPDESTGLAAGSSRIQTYDASDRSIGAEYDLARGAAEPLREDYREYTQLDVGNILFDTLKRPKEELVESKVRMIGRVLKAPRLAKNEAVLYRMVISCCAADSLPIGVLVKLPEKINPPANAWVQVEGRIKLLPFEERLRMIDPVVNMVTPEKTFAYFSAERVTEIACPRDEYLYP